LDNCSRTSSRAERGIYRPVRGAKAQSDLRVNVDTKEQEQSKVDRFLAAGVSGGREGWQYGKIFAIWGAVVFLFTGPASLSRIGLTFPGVVVLYLAGGVVAGAIGAALTSLAPRNVIWRLFAGFLAALLPSAACLAMMIPVAEWRSNLLPVSLVAAGILGPGAALIHMERL